MGVLTENRKLLSEFCSASFSLARPYPYDAVVDLPPAKRPRLSSLSVPPATSEPSSAVSPCLPKVSISRLRQFPLPAPLRRPVHAPQRNSRFARAAPATKTLKAIEGGSERDMGSLFSRLREKSALKQFDWIDETGKGAVKHVSNTPYPARDDYCEGLTVEEYKELVERHEGLSVVSSKDAQVGQSSRVSDSDSTLLTPEKPVQVVADPSVENDSPKEKFTASSAYKSLLETSRSRDSKLNFLDFEVNLFEKKFSDFKLIAPKPAKEDVTRELFIPLTEEDEEKVFHALGGRNRREVLVTHESSNIEITREILQCLRPGAWLNDEVINLYLELLKERERRDAKKFLKCHFFNTFFYKKLTGGRGGYDYRSVKRWTTQRKLGYSLIDCVKIFVPIHKEVHWCLAVINVQEKKFQYLDSLGGRDSNVLSVLAKYLIDEAKDKNNKDIDVSSWTQEFFDDLPEQKNGWPDALPYADRPLLSGVGNGIVEALAELVLWRYCNKKVAEELFIRWDCGVFMIKYADFYSRGLNLCFGQEHMPYFRKRTAKEIICLRAN